MVNLYDIIHLILLVIKKREINQSHPHVSKWCQMSKSISIIDIREEVFHSLILGSYYVVELRSKNFSKFLITPITYNSLKNLRHTPFANGEVKSSDDFNRTIILITLLRRGSQVKRWLELWTIIIYSFLFLIKYNNINI